MKTLLLGDSILRFIPQDIIGEVTNQSRVGQYTWMLERDVPTFNIETFDKVFVLIGINDFLNRDYTAQKTGDCIINVVDSVLAQKPQDLTVLGLLPVLEDTLEESDYCNKNIPLINAIVKGYCDEHSIKYLPSWQPNALWRLLTCNWLVFSRWLMNFTVLPSLRQTMVMQTRCMNWIRRLALPR